MSINIKYEQYFYRNVISLLGLDIRQDVLTCRNRWNAMFQDEDEDDEMDFNQGYNEYDMEDEDEEENDETAHGIII